MWRHKNGSWPDNKSDLVEFPASPSLNEFISILKLVRGRAKDLLVFYEIDHIWFISLSANLDAMLVHEQMKKKNKQQRTNLLAIMVYYSHIPAVEIKK